MKIFNYFTSQVLAICLLLLLIGGCSNDYMLDLQDNYYLCKLDNSDHSIIKRGYVFYNYGKKDIDLETCLKHNHKENCYGLASDTIIEPNIEELGVTDDFIFGRRKEISPSTLDKSFLETLVPLQQEGYFIINKKLVSVETGLTENQFFQQLKKLGIDHDLVKAINDRKNTFVALPQMILNKMR